MKLDTKKYMPVQIVTQLRVIYKIFFMWKLQNTLPSETLHIKLLCISFAFLY
jgi:hypothetical protein